MRTPVGVAAPARRRQHDGPVECTVLSVEGGALMVAPDYDPTLAYGPCRWSRPLDHSHPDAGVFTYGVPPVGTPCLVLFADAGIAHPWVVAFSGWPA